MNEKEAHKDDAQRILEKAEISLWLDTYDDIFSDFDPRPYSKRSLSDDFLNEARKASRDKNPEGLELRLLIAHDKIDTKTEAIIKKRLREHFTKHANSFKRELSDVKTKAVSMVLIGLIMMLGASYIGYAESQSLAKNFLFVLLEPAGWFVTWFALDKLFYVNEVKKADYDFYQKMSKCEIIFSSY